MTTTSKRCASARRASARDPRIDHTPPPAECIAIQAGRGTFLDGGFRVA